MQRNACSLGLLAVLAIAAFQIPIVAPSLVSVFNVNRQGDIVSANIRIGRWIYFAIGYDDGLRFVPIEVQRITSNPREPEQSLGCLAMVPVAA